MKADDREIRTLPPAATQHNLVTMGGWKDGRFGVYVFDDASHHWFDSEKEATEFLRTYDPKRHENN